MPSLKKGVLYSVLFFVVIWMFVLGIIVGRDSAPVKFDTREFQKRLRIRFIAFESNWIGSQCYFKLETVLIYLWFEKRVPG